MTPKKSKNNFKKLIFKSIIMDLFQKIDKKIIKSIAIKTH